MVAVYLGDLSEPLVDSEYKLNNRAIEVDCLPFLQGDPFLGAHFANDPN